MENNNYTFRCFCCLRVYKTIEDLQMHQKKEKVHTGPFQCCECSNLFVLRWRLAKHLKQTRCGRKIHDEETIYVVQIENNNSLNSVPFKKDPNRNLLENNEQNFGLGGELNGEDIEIGVNEAKQSESLTELCDKFLDQSYQQILAFKCSLAGNENLSRKIALEMFDNAVKVITKPFIGFVRDIFVPLQLVQETKSALEKLTIKFQENIESFRTEYNLLKIIKKKKIFTEPIEKIVHEKVKIVQKDNVAILRPVEYKVCVPDLKFHLKLFLEQHNTLSSILQYQEKIKKSNNYNNIINGTLWKTLHQNSDANKKLIPIFLFNDDFVVDHALSHRAQNTSIAGFYIVFPTLPPQERSKTENMMIAAIIKTKDIKQYGYASCLDSMIQMFSEIETDGIDISVDAMTVKVHLVLTQITGDNKGLNSILGYVESFVAHHYCRLCIGERDDIRWQISEKPEQLRTEEMYNEHVTNLDPRNTGIKSTCSFNDLPTFRAHNNFVVDLHHDLFEGVCKIVISHVLLYFIETEKVLTIQQFNELRQGFYTNPDKKNFNDVQISIHHLRKQDIPMTASEIRSFLLHLPLFLDHFVPNKFDDRWKMLIYLVEIVEIILLPEFDEILLEKLDKLIEKHHELFILYIGHITPKGHHILHYSTVIRRLGAPVNYMAMRGEAKHQWVKHVAEATTSRKHITKTICIKDCYSLAARSITGGSFATKISYGKENHEEPSFQRKHFDLLTESGYNLQALVHVNSVTINGITYKKGFVIAVVEGNSRILLKIQYIIKDKETENCFFICDEKNIYDYDGDILAYRIVENTNINCYRIIDPKNIAFEPSIIISLPSGKKAVKLLRKFENII